MADSLPVVPFGIPVFPDIHVPDDDDDGVPDDLPVLPDDVLLMIARLYRLATVEDRDANGWWQVRMKMNYLRRCPKRKRIINLKGFYVPRHGNQLEPVTGYFYRRLIRKMFATKDRDPRAVVPVGQGYLWSRRLPASQPGGRLALYSHLNPLPILMFHRDPLWGPAHICKSQ